MPNRTPIKIHINMAAAVFGNSIREIIGEPITFVDRPEKADLVIYDNPRQVEHTFDKGTPYIQLWGNSVNCPHEPVDPPENVTCLNCDGSLLAVLAQTISALRRKYQLPRDKAPVEKAPEAVAFLPDALRILVVDDNPRHIKSAKLTLAGHYLTTVTGYQEAMDTLASRAGLFDVVLSDLHLPMSSKSMGHKFRLGVEVPYGILLAIEAARLGAKKAAVVTDLSHHDDPFSAAFSHFTRFPILFFGTKVKMLHASIKDGAKDWADALARVEE